ncbi:DUF3489 domain-containing protein [Methylocapsa sp. D3K7]|uniref:DUF3489 domain-containing protein n=1 Tax=Methylocapsa sp. D3K7 TaxID=3041435 RepID=UPI00244E6416|nr:DUF3489 domain-containing protein [Methylocapsa sp. D3K7]WGJ15259.1 DUF3489 domain-containing protein [Methylocapsa sp. D3K7]
MTQLSGIRKSRHLTDAQFLVLSEAAGRDSGVVVIPEQLKGKAAESFVRTLIGKGLVREVRSKTGMPVWRRNVETGKTYALVITAVGCKAIPIETTHQNSHAIPAKKSGGTMKGDSPKEPSDDATPRARTTKSRVRPSETSGRTGNTSHTDVDRPLKNALREANAPRPGSKLAGVIILLSREQGAGIEELTAATGWLPHTTRAALTGLRKRGYVLGRERREGADTIYRILSEPHAQAA